MKDKDEIIVYQPQSTLRLEVRIQDETVWLTQAQIAELFGTKRPAITKHLNNIYLSGELTENSTCSILEHMGNDGKQSYQTKYYNLDAILSVGYRVNSRNATSFRQWATQVLRNYLLKGYSINQRMDRMEHTLIEQSQMSSELTADSTVRKFRTVRLEGGRKIARNLDYYNLDVIISVGYRVNTKCGIRFRQWATNVIKSYLLKGYTINQRIELIEQRMNSKFSEYDEKFDFFIKTSLPPVEGVFYDGQLFDAYKFASDLIRTATKSLILIDNYIDDTVLTLFTKRIPGVSVTIYTAQISKQLSLDLQRHNSQYEPIDIRQFKQSHDRFLIIDEKELYHIGASLKDLGKKWFAFSKMQLDIKEVLKHL